MNTNHPHLEGLIRKWRELAPNLRASQEAIYLICADELEAALAALPGGGVDEAMVKRFLNFQPLADENDPVRMWQLIRDDVDFIDVTRAALKDALTPTPNPHEADRNG